MSLCPDHGGYTGDACKKCQEPMQKLGPIPPVDPTLKKQLSDLSGPPKLDEHDKLTASQLENATLRAQQNVQLCQSQLNNFIRAMFEKYQAGNGYQFDLEKLDFVPRAM